MSVLHALYRNHVLHQWVVPARGTTQSPRVALHIFLALLLSELSYSNACSVTSWNSRDTCWRWGRTGPLNAEEPVNGINPRTAAKGTSTVPGQQPYFTALQRWYYAFLKLHTTSGFKSVWYDILMVMIQTTLVHTFVWELFYNSVTDRAFRGSLSNSFKWTALYWTLISY
jgi:hypothetical protein